jgi:hypothetical protein
MILVFLNLVNHELTRITTNYCNSSINKGIDNNSTLAYVAPKFQMFFEAPVAQPG